MRTPQHIAAGRRIERKDQRLWADALFFRRLKDLSTPTAPAILARWAYRKVTIADHLFERAELMRQGSL